MNFLHQHIYSSIAAVFCIAVWAWVFSQVKKIESQGIEPEEMEVDFSDVGLQASLEIRMFTLMNNSRLENGFFAVERDPLLDAAAFEHLREMAATKSELPYFTSENPDTVQVFAFVSTQKTLHAAFAALEATGKLNNKGINSAGIAASSLNGLIYTVILLAPLKAELI